MYQDQAEKIQLSTKDLNTFILELRKELIEAAGGLDENDQPKKKENKDITTNILVNNRKGYELADIVNQSRENLLNLIQDEAEKTRLAQNMPLKINPLPANSNKKDWTTFTFQQMPVAAVLPLLSKFQNDLKVSEALLLKYFLGKTGITRKQDAFIPVVAANKSYVIKDEGYEAEIFLGSYSSTVDNLKVSVDGRPITVRDGKAIFKITPSNLGIKQHTAKITLRDPLTGELESFSKRFEYEVGERSATISADKMNVLYVGVDNPLSVAVAGVPSEKIQVVGSGITVNKLSGGKYSTKPNKVGVAKITISGGGLAPTTFKYRVKKIPDPVVKVGRKNGGTINAAEFKAQRGIIPHLENFDFEARCKIRGFEFARVPKNGDAQVYTNNGGAFDTRSKRMIEQASRGDLYYFSEIKCKCPGDEVNRNLNGIVFNIR